MITIKDDIIKEMGLNDLSEENREKILNEITESAMKNLIAGLLSRLSDSEMEEFEKIQKNASPKEIDAFLKSKISNYEQTVEKIVAEFKDDMKESINGLKMSLE